MEFDMTKMVEKITMQVEENQEEFIFETIYPYCENILQMKINKEELKQILLNGMQKQQPCEDCISREAVEKITWEEPSYTDALNVLTEVRDKVRALPSVTPKTDILGKIKAEIADLEEGISSYHNDRPWVFKDEVLQIIDKYKTESEDKE